MASKRFLSSSTARYLSTEPSTSAAASFAPSLSAGSTSSKKPLSKVLQDVHLPLLSLKNETNLFVPLPASIFDATCHPSLTHLLVRQHLASLRQGTHANLSRYDIAYSNKKIQRQKGTGRARVGDRGSPIRKGGGRAFAKSPRDYSFHVNRKMVDLGLRAALGTRWRNDELRVLQDVSVDWQGREGKTGVLKALLEGRGWLKETNATLFLLGQSTLKSEEGRLFERGVRNLSSVEVLDTTMGMNVYHLLKPARVVMDLQAVGEISQRFLPVEELEARAIVNAEAYLEDLEEAEAENIDWEAEVQSDAALSEDAAEYDNIPAGLPTTMEGLHVRAEERAAQQSVKA